MRTVPQVALDFIKAHEGVKLVGYLDSAGIATIGVGHIGPSVTVGMKISQAQADAFLRQDLAHAAERLEARIGAVVEDLTEHQYAALISFVFNLGASPGWGIWKKLRARQFDAIPAELMRFVNAGGQKIAGLVNRRADEVKLWATDEPGIVPATPPSSVTRAMETLPTATIEKPLVKQTTFVTKAVGTVALVGGSCAQYVPTVKSWADQLKDYTDSPIVAHVAMGLTTLAGGLLIASLVASFVKQKAAKA